MDDQTYLFAVSIRGHCRRPLVARLFDNFRLIAARAIQQSFPNSLKQLSAEISSVSVWSVTDRRVAGATETVDRASDPSSADPRSQRLYPSQSTRRSCR